MKSSFYAKNKSEQMPIYNRNFGHGRLNVDKDIALQTHKKQVFLEREVKTDDTLQSIALEFNVTVAELKRINNIHKENEIHARKVVKIPSNPLSLLLEQEYFCQATEDPAVPEINIETKVDSCDVLIETVNNSNCKPINCDENPADQEPGNFGYMPVRTDESESLSLLSNETTEHQKNEVISCNGADWGISWSMLIIVVLVIGIGGPVLLFWIIKWRPEKTKES